MCRDKQPVKQKVKEETSSSKKCKLLAESDEDKSPAPEKEYEFKIKVINATSGKAVNRAKINIIIEKVGYPYTSNSEGLIVLTAKAANIEYEMQLALKRDSKYNLKGEMPKLKSQEKGGEPTIVQLERMMLDITKTDPHFVPTGKADAENLDIEIAIAKIANLKPKPKVYLQIKTAVHTPEIVYEYLLTDPEMADGKRILKWDGKTTCAKGPLSGKLISPAFGPYTLALIIKDNDFTGEKAKTNVLVHNIKIEQGSYIENPASPPLPQIPIPARTAPNWTQHMQWVQYRLNELGYFAGRVDGTENAQTKKAIRRYTYEMINQPVIDDPSNGNFITSLAGNTLSTPLFENAAVLSDNGTNSKIYIQNNYYYPVITNYDLLDGHAVREKDTLDRFQCAITAKVQLKSKTGAAVDAPDALAQLKILWTLEDPDEDFGNIPPHVAGTSPSKAQFYIKNAMAKVKARNGNTMGDNCPARCGGVSTAQEYIKTAHSDCYVVKNTQTQYESVVCSDTNKTGLVGKSTVIFAGSYIGGDNYKVKAKVSFFGMANQTIQEAEYNKIASTDKEASTGIMTVWRKLRAVYVLDWLPARGPAVDWTETKNAFKAAYIEFDHNPVQHVMLASLVNAANASDYLDAVHFYLNRSADAIYKPFVARNNLVFQSQHMLPVQFTKQATENDKQFKDRIGAIAGNFPSLVTSIATGREKVGIGEWIRTIVEVTQRPGIVVLRTLPFSGLTVNETINTITKRKFRSDKITTTINTVDNFQRAEGSSCTGLAQGVALITEGYRKILKDGFLNTHEIAHCLNLNHPHDGAGIKPTDGANYLKNKTFDHDCSDSNDMMSYLHTGAPNGRSAVPLGTGSPNLAQFCGKCQLKLRGWKVNGHNTQIAKLLAHKHTEFEMIPINPRMQFVAPIRITGGSYTDTTGQKRRVDCLKFVHEHKFTWESNTGDLNDLKDLETREEVHYDKPTQGDPFTYTADPDQHFGQNGGSGKDGVGGDDHSVTLPSILCKNPRIAGKITAVQKYQYRKLQQPGQPKDAWKDIPEAIFLLEKEVLKENDVWVFRFCKSNGPGNPTPFKFEVKYKIGDQPPHMPERLNNPDHVPLGANPIPFVAVVSGVYYKSGQHKIKLEYTNKYGIPATDQELQDHGCLGYTLTP